MIITYLNGIGTPVTSQQAKNLEKYSIVYSIDDKRKKRELYIKKELACIFYYRDSNETENQAFTLLMAYGISFVIREIQFIGNYRYEISNGYSKTGDLINITHSLYNNMNNEFIGEEYIDLITNLPKYDETIKKYYDRNIDPNHEIFEGVYNEDGSLDYIKYNSYNSNAQDSIWFGVDGIEDEEDIPTLCKYTQLPAAFIDYYLNANILPPPVL